MRIFLLAWLSALLLGLQQVALVHPLQHDADRFADARHTALHASANGPCVTCALLAGGTHAVTSAGALSLPAALPPALAVAFGRSVATAAPAYYSSRAPPVLL